MKKTNIVKKQPTISTIMKILILLLSFALINNSNAGTILEEFSKLPSPSNKSTNFEKWTYSTALITSQHCWHSQNPQQELPPELKKNVARTGSWELPTKQENEKLCASIEKNGINPVCTHSHISTDKDLPGFNREYLYVSHKKFVVTGGLFCYLNLDQVQKQFFVEDITYEWSQEPHMQTLNTQDGPQLVNMGNILITFPTAKNLSYKTYQEPRIVILK
jgi:hypothetical protein